MGTGSFLGGSLGARGSEWDRDLSGIWADMAASYDEEFLASFDPRVCGDFFFLKKKEQSVFYCLFFVLLFSFLDFTSC